MAPQVNAAAPADGGFREFIRRIRAGDEQAAVDLVRQYEPAIRTEVRMRLSDPRLYRTLDSMDICQSVLLSFFARAALGQYDLDRPDQLLRLLVAIARKKVALQARWRRAQRRDHRRDVSLDREEPATAPDPSPSRLAAGKELLQEFRSRLSVDERRLADLRGEGREWSEIAAEVGGTSQARRKQLARAVDRVAHALGLEGPDDV
jgi:RNA polymerase sigma-70 factor (ECF subfamily)